MRSGRAHRAHPPRTLPSPRPRALAVSLRAPPGPLDSGSQSPACQSTRVGCGVGGGGWAGPAWNVFTPHPHLGVSPCCAQHTYTRTRTRHATCQSALTKSACFACALLAHKNREFKRQKRPIFRKEVAKGWCLLLPPALPQPPARRRPGNPRFLSSRPPASLAPPPPSPHPTGRSAL